MLLKELIEIKNKTTILEYAQIGDIGTDKYGKYKVISGQEVPKDFKVDKLSLFRPSHIETREYSNGRQRWFTLEKTNKDDPEEGIYTEITPDALRFLNGDMSDSETSEYAQKIQTARENSKPSLTNIIRSEVFMLDNNQRDLFWAKIHKVFDKQVFQKRLASLDRKDD